ncbi:hypothetical protein ACFSX9_13890 [Flavobacterium ardleyense]|uniref:Lipocalin-like domain-containing protein n=1 Tax=Flavobacterium ardleyense TaxID=2038737 RepID=A0ABW5ZAA2_9FLAO
MKKRISLFVSVLILALVSTSCSKDDDGPSGNIVGKWEFFKEGVVVNNVESLEFSSYTDGCSKDFTEIREDGTLSTTFYYETNCLSEIIDATYTKSGNSLIISQGGQTREDIIKELTQTTLKLYYTETSGGVEITKAKVFKRIN